MTDTVEKGWKQQAYELELVCGEGLNAVSPGCVDSIESVRVEWPWATLESRVRARGRVCV